MIAPVRKNLITAHLRFLIRIQYVFACLLKTAPCPQLCQGLHFSLASRLYVIIIAAGFVCIETGSPPSISACPVI